MSEKACLTFHSIRDTPCSMNVARYFAASVYHPSHGFIVTGGHDGSRRLNSVEKTLNGRSFTALPNMPLALHGHCMVMISSDAFLMTGGYGNSGVSQKTFLFHFGSEWWEEVEDMPTGRFCE